MVNDMNQKILIIMPKYYGYESVIRNNYIEKGYDVEVIYENIDHVNLIFGCIKKCCGYWGKKIINKFICSQIKKKGRNASIILVIRGSFLNNESMQLLKNVARAGAKFFLYQWDSVHNNPNSATIAEHFDMVSTFDNADAMKYGWNYRPLFYFHENFSKFDRKYKTAYICTLHSKRANILYALKNDKRLFPQYLFVYSERFHFFKQKYLNRNSVYTAIKNSDVSHKPLSLKDTQNVMSNSEIIIDYTHPNQNGLTMRTIESIGNRCKLVTNNKFVLSCDFYNENNVFVYDENDFKIPDNFLETRYVDLPDNIYRKYSIDNWTSEVIGEG